jgi:hypothetical protein
MEVVPPPDQEDSGANVGTKDELEDDILDLSTLIPSRKRIRLPIPKTAEGEPDSGVFELRLLDDFGIMDQQRLLSWSRRFETLWNSDEDLSNSEQEDMLSLMNKMFTKVLDAPEDVKAACPPNIKSRVVTAFTLVPLIERQKREAAEEEAKQKAAGQSTSES